MAEEKDLVVDFGLDDDYEMDGENADIFISDEEFRENIGIAVHTFQFIEDIGDSHIKILQSGLKQRVEDTQIKCLEIICNSIELIHGKTIIEDGE
jgi:hypothetical protein